VLLHLVTDVVLSQNWLAKCFGIHEIKIENAGQGGGVKGADLVLVAMDDPRLIKKLLLIAAGSKRNGRAVTKDLVEQWAKSGYAGAYGDADMHNGNSVSNGGVSEHAVVQMTESVQQLNATLQRLERLAALHLQASGQQALAVDVGSSAAAAAGSVSDMSIPSQSVDML
jgi:hypothetical protein